MYMFPSLWFRSPIDSTVRTYLVVQLPISSACVYSEIVHRPAILVYIGSDGVVVYFTSILVEAPRLPMAST